ncbi:MAG: tetratricopeptide repeat protein [Saprospiraceae bacterium]
MSSIYKIGIFLILLYSSATVHAQALEEEIGFVYVKAEYLYETGRFDEAVTSYNIVISKDAAFKDALIHRGFAKYALAAYKGAKMDAVQSIDLKGINSEAAALLGRAFAAMGDLEAGANSLTAAISLDEKNVKYYEWRASIFEMQKLLIKACSDYEKAMNLGSLSAEVKAKNLCGIAKNKQVSNYQPVAIKQPDPVTAPPTSEPKSENIPSSFPSNDEKTRDSTSTGDVTQTIPPTSDQPNISTTQDTLQGDGFMMDDSEPFVDENLPKNDDSVNKFVIDDDLFIEISGQELGLRSIKEIPSILILANENGNVTVNICVNKEGVVTKAEFNATLSTIAKKSMVSLALRKAKEFEFQPGKYDMQCGVMIFHVKGS